RIAYLGGDVNISSSRERLNGFMIGMSQQGLTVNPSLIIEGDFGQESGYDNVQKLIHAAKERPEAICCVSDLAAFGAIKGLRDMGLRVPEDIAVMGNDNNAFSDNFLVPLTTINHPNYEIGSLAMEFMLNQILHKEVHYKQIILNPTLVI